MCAEVDLRPINKPLVKEVAVRSKRAIHPQIKRAILLSLALLTTLITYYAISRYVVAAVVIKGRSMAPTLNDGDRYVLNRWLYYFREPRPGDLVVIHDPGHNDLAVKRVVAIPSDTLLFEDGKVYVNGFKLSESYLAPNTRTTAPQKTGPRIRLAKDQYYVLGDNRANSEDSRFYGSVHRDLIVGLISK
jgi:signal peptidase I